jgi:hypothetical protein
MSGKGAKGLITGKTPALNKDKKKPITRSSRAGLQVPSSRSLYLMFLSNSLCIPIGFGFLGFSVPKIGFFFRIYVIIYAPRMRIIFCDFIDFGKCCLMGYKHRFLGL